MIVLDRNVSCKDSQGRTGIIVGNSVNEIGAFNSKRITEIESPITLRGGKFDIGKIGAFSFINENVTIRNVQEIGRYVQIGLNVIIGMPLVNEATVCSNPVFGPYRNAMFSEFSNIQYSDDWLVHMKHQIRKVSYKNDTNCIIGNDVYIGDNSVVKKGCIIGDGAHVLPCSYVCDDIPPYAIVSGCPATIIGYRFGDEEIKRLLNISWWKYEPSMVEDVDIAEVENFITIYEKKINDFQAKVFQSEKFIINPIEKTIILSDKNKSESLIYRGW